MWVWAVLWLCRDEHSLESIHRRVGFGDCWWAGGRRFDSSPSGRAGLGHTPLLESVARAVVVSRGVCPGWLAALLAGGVRSPLAAGTFAFLRRGGTGAAFGRPLPWVSCLAWAGVVWVPASPRAPRYGVDAWGAGSGVSDSRLVCSEVRCGRPRPPAAPRHVANAMGRFRGPARRKARPAPPGAATFCPWYRAIVVVLFQAVCVCREVEEGGFPLEGDS